MTRAFAVSALRGWWQREGSLRYPGARRLLVTCDAGGSNSCTSRLWKARARRPGGQSGLEITVLHFPPGTTKWNKIEHRLFCHITRTWRGRPLMTPEDAVAGIAATTTYAGLKVTAVLDANEYPKGQEIADERMKYLEAAHPGPRRRPRRVELHRPAQPPAPSPNLIRNQPRSRPGAAPRTS